MMQQNNKDIAIAFQLHLAANDWDQADPLVSEDAVFVSADGTAIDWPTLKGLFQAGRPLMERTLQIEISHATAEDDRVSLEMTGWAPLKNGKTYRNRYHSLYFLRDGRIVRAHEYCDPNAMMAFAD